MKRFAVLVLTLLMALCANAAPKEAYELVAFDYSELAIETDNSVRITWSGTVESLLTVNGQCRVVITLTMDDGKEHTFATNPFDVQGLGQAEVSGEFIIPRRLWDDAANITVGALDNDAKANASYNSADGAPAQEGKNTLEECIRQTIADESAFLFLRNEIDDKKAELSALETEIMISSGLMRQQESPQRKMKRQQEHMKQLEQELEALLEQLRVNIENYCGEQ